MLEIIVFITMIAIYNILTAALFTLLDKIAQENANHLMSQIYSVYKHNPRNTCFSSEFEKAHDNYIKETIRLHTVDGKPRFPRTGY